MTHRRRQARKSRQQRIGFESLESRQVLTAGLGGVDPDLWAWDAGAAAESADILAESWVASDGWYDDNWWVDDGSWVDDTSWNDGGSWSNDDWWVTADWSGDDSAFGTDVVTAFVDAVADEGSGLQTAIKVDVGSTVTGEAAVSEPNPFAPEATPGPEAVPAAETFIVSLTPYDVAAESVHRVELSVEPVTEVLWGTVFEDLTAVTVATATADTTAGDQHESVIDVPSFELILEGFDPAPAVLDDAAVTELDDPVVMVDEPVATVDEPVAMVDEPVVMVDEPVVMVDDPVVMVDDPVVMVDDPVVMVDEPVVMVDEPVATVDESVAVVPSTPLPAGRTPAKTQSVAGRFTSWAGMFVQGFGGFSGSSDAASLSDSEIPGRGRLRGRLPFRPAN
jgi:hypothetical protein